MSLLRIEAMIEELVVIFLNVSCSGEFQQVVAMVHERAKTLQRAHHLCYVGDDGFVIVVHLRHEVIGNGRVDAELHLLRVDKHQLQLVRMLLVEQGCDDYVQAY